MRLPGVEWFSWSKVRSLALTRLNQTVQRDAQIILNARVLKHTTAWSSWGNVESSFYVFPVDNVGRFLGYDNNDVGYSITHDRCEVRRNSVLPEHRNLLRIALLQVGHQNGCYFIYSCRFPLHGNPQAASVPSAHPRDDCGPRAGLQDRPRRVVWSNGNARDGRSAVERRRLQLPFGRVTITALFWPICSPLRRTDGRPSLRHAATGETTRRPSRLVEGDRGVPGPRRDHRAALGEGRSDARASPCASQEQLRLCLNLRARRLAEKPPAPLGERESRSGEFAVADRGWPHELRVAGPLAWRGCVGRPRGHCRRLHRVAQSDGAHRPD